MLSYYQTEAVLKMTQKRAGETKIGETIHVLENLNTLANCPAQFVLLGIEEDIGVRANLGRSGAHQAWRYFLPAFLNLQDNHFLLGKNIALAGRLAFADLMRSAERLEASSPSDLEQLRALTAEVDEVVTATVANIFKAGKTPIVIGGGHNNAYGIISGSYQMRKKPLSVLNIDPHADYRALEGRHSGNGFSYAHAKKMISQYAVFGLHESYNSAATMSQFHEQANLYYLSFDELLTFSTVERDRLFKDVLHWLGTEPIGLELDLDAISNFPASALNASGFSMRQARLMIKTAAALKQPLYFHLAEAAPALAPSDESKMYIGKSLSYLVSDFIKSWG